VVGFIGIGSLASAQVTMSTTATGGGKTYLSIDNKAVVTNIDTLFARLNALSSSVGSLTWGDVLDNSAIATQDLDLNGHNATGAIRIQSDSLEAVVAIADSLVASVGIRSTGTVTAGGFAGDLTGNVTGDLTGSATVGAGETLDVSAGTLTLADDQISGDKIDGGRISNLMDLDTDSLHAGWGQFTGRLDVDGGLTLGNSTATGSNAVARGYGALAAGNNSVALDSLARAYGNSSKAIGRDSKTYSPDAIALGYNSQAADSTAWATSTQGWGAMAFGANSEARGTHSVTLGDNASIDASSTNALGLCYNSQISTNSQFSTALGYGSIVTGSTGALALGYSSKANSLSQFSVALGYNSTVQNTGTVATGYNSSATMFHALAMGSSSTASGTHSMAFGQNSTASMDQAIAMGRGTSASAPHAFALGESSTASGYGARSFGPASTASGANSYAFGQNATASGYGSLAFGANSTATTGHAIALGEGADAMSYGSLALGWNSETFGSQSLVHAAASQSNSVHEVVLGAYADSSAFSGANRTLWVPTDPLFVIGNGSSTSSRSNAMTVLKDGTTTFSDSLSVLGNATFAGELSIGDTLHAAAPALFADSVAVGGSLSVAQSIHTQGVTGASGTPLALDSDLAITIIAGSISGAHGAFVAGASGGVGIVATDEIVMDSPRVNIAELLQLTPTASYAATPENGDIWFEEVSPTQANLKIYYNGSWRTILAIP